MLNIPNVFRTTPSRKTLKKNLPGQTEVAKGQPVEEYKAVDRRQTSERRKKQRSTSVDTRAQDRRTDDGEPHIDIDA